jgi:hypothetical protein
MGVIGEGAKLSSSDVGYDRDPGQYAADDHRGVALLTENGHIAIICLVQSATAASRCLMLSSMVSLSARNLRGSGGSLAGNVETCGVGPGDSGSNCSCQVEEPDVGVEPMIR